MARAIGRIAFITPQYPPARSGIGDFAQHLSTAMSNHARIDVITLTTANTASETPNLRIHPVVHGLRWRDGLALLRALRRADPQVVLLQISPLDMYHASALFLMVLPLLVRLLLRRPVVLIVHEIVGRIKLQAHWSAAVAVVDRDYIEPFSALNPRVAYVQLASNIERVRLSDSDRAQIRRDWDLPAGAPVIAFFGYMYPTKGFGVLLEAVRRLRTDREVTLLVLGDIHPDFAGEREEWLRSTGERGPVEVASLLAAVDVCAFPFLEGSSWRRTSLLAALTQDVQVVTTEGLGVPMDGLTYVPVGDIPALREAIGRAIATPFRGSRALPTWADAAEQMLAVCRDARTAPWPSPRATAALLARMLREHKRRSASAATGRGGGRASADDGVERDHGHAGAGLPR